jgi:hypothetical protein
MFQDLSPTLQFFLRIPVILSTTKTKTYYLGFRAYIFITVAFPHILVGTEFQRHIKKKSNDKLNLSKQGRKKGSLTNEHQVRTTETHRYRKS